ncbi:MAG: hypothetical protein WA741_34190 [Candidatus Sulfotelmatobacter sp.]
MAGIRTWNSLGRFVKRGEKGILILAPMVGKKRTQNDDTEPTEDAKSRASTLFGFRAAGARGSTPFRASGWYRMFS